MKNSQRRLEITTKNNKNYKLFSIEKTSIQRELKVVYKFVILNNCMYFLMKPSDDQVHLLYNTPVNNSCSDTQS